MARAEERAWLYTIVAHITLLSLFGRAVVATTFDADGDASGGEGSCCCRLRSAVVHALPVRCGVLTLVHITLLDLLGRTMIATTFDTDGNTSGGESSCFRRFRLVVIGGRRCGVLTLPHDKILLDRALLGVIRRAMVATTFDADRNASGCEGSYFREVRSVMIDALLIS